VVLPFFFSPSGVELPSFFSKWCGIAIFFLPSGVELPSFFSPSTSFVVFFKEFPECRQAKLENDDTCILHEADIGDTYNARGVQFTCKLVFLLRIVQ
jgi:hypothetical protein